MLNNWIYICKNVKENSKIETHSVYVEPFHVDFSGNIFLGLLGNHLLNAADKHSHKRGWGIGTLNKNNCTWVLSRLTIEMFEMPRQYDQFQVDTWVEGVMKLFTSRNFAVLKPDGTPYGYARSVWAMIDMETRKPCDLLALYDGDILNYVVSEEERPCPIEGHGRFRFKDPKHVRTIDTYYSDVDINGHINSIKYIEHILDLFQKEKYVSQHVRRFEIAYKAEAYMGDKLSFYQQGDAENIFEIEVKKNDSETVCQAKICFE